MKFHKSTGNRGESPNLGKEADPVMVRRRYSAGLRPLGTQEWSAWVSDGASGWCVPLGSSDPQKAEQSLEEMRRDVKATGWQRAGNRLAREFTLAIFWLENPVACTYVSLFTLPESLPPVDGTGAPCRMRIAVIESDPVFRAAICSWLNRLPGVQCEGWEDERSWISQPRRQVGVQVLLVDRLSPFFGGEKLKSGKPDQGEGPFVFGYGIYADGDDIFASVSGVDAGYYLRRRFADTLLDPLLGAVASGRLVPGEVPRSLRRYFQNLFHPDAGTSSSSSLLTPRERQILTCLQRGLHDKEIASELGISPLTVHTHLKHIFEKLNAHTRTEAVVKYLEK